MPRVVSQAHMDLPGYYFIAQLGIIGVLIFGFAYLIALAFVRRDFDAIKNRPFAFILEWILVSILPALPLLFFTISRGLAFGVAFTWAWSLALKFAVFHILFQVSGFYTYLFS